MQVGKKWFMFIAVAGGVLFLLQAFFLLLYWNWPFGSTIDRSHLPFIALAVSMLGYLLALWSGKYGGLIMICGALTLAISVFISPKDFEFFAKIVVILIFCSPTAIIGGFFIYLSSRGKNQPSLN